MKKASVEGDANTDDDQLSRSERLGRNIYALMEAHRARTAVAGAASTQLPPSPAVPSPKLAPSFEVPVAASPELAPSLDVSVAALPTLTPSLDVPTAGPSAASPQPPSPAMPSADELGRAILERMETRRARTVVPVAASPRLPPSPAEPVAASPKLAPSLDLPVAASPQLAPSLHVPGAAPPRLPPSSAVPGAASPQGPPSAREEAPPTEGQPAPVGSRRTDLYDRVSPDAPPRMPTGMGGPNIEFRPGLGPRQHDGVFSINEAPSRSSSEADVAPKPPVPMRGGASRVGGLILLFLIAGISAFGLVLITLPDRTALVSPSGEPATTEVAGTPASGKQREHPAAMARLLVEDRRAYVNEPLLLGLSLDGASGGEFLLINGLDAATRLSAGTLIGPNSWRVSTWDLGDLWVYAPKDYVGTMDAVVDLHTTDDRRVDRQRIQLEWLPVTSRHADVPVSPDRRPVQALPEMLKASTRRDRSVAPARKGYAQTQRRFDGMAGSAARRKPTKPKPRSY